MRTRVFGAVIVLVMVVVRSRSEKPNMQVYADRSPMATLSLVVVREVLQRLQETPSLERSARDSTSIEVAALARDSVKLSLMAYMGYQGEDECMERTSCEAGELLRSFTTSAAFLFTALDYMAPFHLRRYLSIARDAAEGHSCIYYRCGARPYQSLGEAETNELE